MYRWEHLGKSHLLAEESLALGLQPCLPLPTGAPLLPFHPPRLPDNARSPSAPCPEHSFPSPAAWAGEGWGAGEHRQAATEPFQEVREIPVRGGRIKLPASGRSEKQALVSASVEREGGSSPGLLMDQMQNCRLGSVHAPVPAECRVPGPREERCSPRSGWLAGALAPTPGFMVLPLSGSL